MKLGVLAVLGRTYLETGPFQRRTMGRAQTGRRIRFLDYRRYITLGTAVRRYAGVSSAIHGGEKTTCLTCCR